MNDSNTRTQIRSLPPVERGRWRIFRLLVALWILLAVVIQAPCAILYTVENYTSTLYTIDTTTLAVNSVGTLGVGFAFGDLAWNPNTQTLYMVDGRGAQSLYTVNTTTGAATLVGPHNVVDLFGLTYDTATTTLYGGSFDDPGQFYRLNTATGEATVIGSGIGLRIGALAYNPSANLILALNDCIGCASLYSVDPATGAGTLLRADLDTDNSGMTYDPILNRYWDLDYDGRLSYFDPANGYEQVQVTVLPGSFDGLAFVGPVNATNAPPTVTCPPATVEECGASAQLTAQVSDPDGDAMTVVWTLNGTPVQTNQVPAGSPGAPANVTLSGSFPLGTNILAIGVTDGTNVASCTTTVTVLDTTPPVISNVTASPNFLWPPNHQMVKVNVKVSVSDTCSPATWKIVGVRCNEPVDGRGDGKTSPDWKITSDRALQLRAEHSGNGNGRMYTITVQATDASGNKSQTQTLTVTVPKSQGKPKK
jgi:hypothetical protein